MEGPHHTDDRKYLRKIKNYGKMKKGDWPYSRTYGYQAPEKRFCMDIESCTTTRNALQQHASEQGTENLRNPNNCTLINEDLDVIMTDIEEDKCIIKAENYAPADVANEDTYPDSSIISLVPCLCLSTEDLEEPATGKKIVKVNGHVFLDSYFHCQHLGNIDIADGTSVESATQQLENLCGQWKIEPKKVTAVVTKADSSLNTPIRTIFGKGKVIYCFLERVNHVGLKIFEMEIVKDIMLNIKLKLSFLGDDGQNNSDANSDEGTSRVNLKCRYDKWFTDYKTFKNCLEILQEKRSNCHPLKMFTELEEFFIKDIGEILKALNMLIIELAQEKKMYISEVIPMLWLFKRNLSKYKPTCYRGRNFKHDIEELIESSFHYIEFMHFFAISTLLDPRFKRFYFDDQTARKQTEKHINGMIKEIGRKTTMKNVATCDSIWNGHDAIYFSNAGIGKQSELNRFLDDPLLPRSSTDPVQFWYNNSSCFPNLSKIAIEFLCIPM